MTKKVRMIVGKFNIATTNYIEEKTLVFNYGVNFDELFNIGCAYADNGYDVVCEVFDSSTGYGIEHLFAL